jgi:hypothetical protein
LIVIGSIYDPQQCLVDPVNELLTSFRNKVSEPLGLHQEPKSIDGIIIGRIWWQKAGFEVSPVEKLFLMPGSVIANDDIF